MTRPAAWIILFISGGTAAWSFRWIVRWYRTPGGFPWLMSLIFAAAALAALFALHALFGAQGVP